MTDTKNYSSKALKGRNLAWIIATLVLDSLILFAGIFHSLVDDLTPTRLMWIRGSLTTLLPIPALVLSSLIPTNAKAVLIFWRVSSPLPGSRAFTVHAPADDRIDIAKLKKNVGAFPTDERDQNAKWYGLYKQVDSDPSVVDSHKNYLLFRDIAAMSLLLAVATPLLLIFSGVDFGRVFACFALFGTQYLLAAFSAKNTGIRFVQNVLAVHSHRKVTNSRATKAPTSKAT